MNTRATLLRTSIPTRTCRWLMSTTRAGRKGGCVSTSLMKCVRTWMLLMPGINLSHNLYFASPSLIAGDRRIFRMSSFAQRHAPYRDRAVISSLRGLLDVNLVVIKHAVVITSYHAATLSVVLNVSTQAFFGFGHRRNCSKFFQQCVPSEGALDSQGCISRLDSAVLTLKHLDLLV